MFVFDSRLLICIASLRTASHHLDQRRICKLIRPSVAGTLSKRTLTYLTAGVSIFFDFQASKQTNNMKLFETTKCCFIVDDLKVAGLIIGVFLFISALASAPGSSIHRFVICGMQENQKFKEKFED